MPPWDPLPGIPNKRNSIVCHFCPTGRRNSKRRRRKERTIAIQGMSFSPCKHTPVCSSLLARKGRALRPFSIYTLPMPAASVGRATRSSFTDVARLELLQWEVHRCSLARPQRNISVPLSPISLVFSQPFLNTIFTTSSHLPATLAKSFFCILWMHICK